MALDPVDGSVELGIYWGLGRHLKNDWPWPGGYTLPAMTGTGGTEIDYGAGRTDDLISISHEPDCALTSVALTLFAVTLGHAVDLKDGTYSTEALGWVTLSIIFCLVGVISPRVERLELLCRRTLPAFLAFGIVDQTIYLMMRMKSDPQITLAFGTIALLGAMQFFDLKRLRLPLMAIMVLAFFIAGELAFNLHSKDPRIDVFMFQTNAAYAMSHGINPYTFRYPSMYPPGTPYYGPGVVDAHGMLTVGFPYPPLSLFLVMPGYLLGSDIRYSHLAAMGLSAGLILATRPGRISALAATLLLLMPRSIYVLDLSWTEPLLVLMFSFVMFCVFRWPKALPYALGLFLSTKQYTILTIPLLPLLIEGPHHWRTLRNILFKAGLVVAAINLPFLIWNFHEFFRALVLFQFLQGFRNDALSYLVLIKQNYPNVTLPVWISLLPLVVVIPLSLRRLASSPAGFAAAVTVVYLFFFAFNKQAFCNYYYFVIATACWAIAAGNFGDVTRVDRSTLGYSPA
jgi:hypothetical protein